MLICFNYSSPREDKIMFALIISIIAASVFGVIATQVLGSNGLLTNAWVDVIFWSLIGAGVALAAINITWECVPCRFSQLWLKRSLIKRLCHNPLCED